MKRALAIACIAVLAGCAVQESHGQMMNELVGEPSAMIGDPPDATAGKALIEAEVRRTLKDPDSARFEWPNGFVQGFYRHPLGPKYDGWITCGTVNAKNSYGGYTGALPVVGVIRGGAVTITDMDEPGRYGGWVELACRKMGMPTG